MATAVNLAPGTEVLAAARRRQRMLTMLTVAGAVLLGIIWLILFTLRANVQAGIQEAEGNLRAVETQIANLNQVATRIQLFENRLNSVSQLLTGHISWNPLLREVERLLPPPAVLQAMKADIADGTIMFNGITSNLDQLAQAIASLENDAQHPSLFSSAYLEGAESELVRDSISNEIVSNQYKFAIRFRFNPAALQAGGGGL